MLRYLRSWIDQLRWQHPKPFERLAWLLLDHLEDILNSCRTRIAMGVEEAIDGNLKALLRRGRGYKQPPLLVTDGLAHGGPLDGIRHREESSLKRGRLRILARNPF